MSEPFTIDVLGDYWTSSPCGRWAAYCRLDMGDGAPHYTLYRRGESGEWERACRLPYRPADLFGLPPQARFYVWEEDAQEWR
jgi:hypothetical protein